MFSESCHAENEQLVARINAGIDTADNMLLLYQQNRGLIYTIANKFTGLAELEDLMQEGYIALYEAVRHFDADSNVKFSSYAGTVIKRHMKRYIYGNSAVTMSEHMAALLMQYKQLCSVFLSENGREPTGVEICRYLEINNKTLALLKKAVEMSQIASLDTPIGEDDGESTLCDMIKGECNTEQEVLDRIQQEELKEVIWKAVDELPQQQADVLRKRYIEKKTLRETGESVGITLDKARREEDKALRALRDPVKFKRLYSFSDNTIYSMALKGNGWWEFNYTWTSATERVALQL